MIRLIAHILIFCLLALGLFLLTRKKLIIHRSIEHLIIIAIFLNNILLGNIQYYKATNTTAYIILFSFGLVLFYLFILKGRYSLYNVKMSEAIFKMQDILTEKNFQYECEHSTIKLTQYSDKVIFFEEFGGITYMNTRSVMKLEGFSSVISDFKLGLKNFKSNPFPLSGIIYIITSLLVIILLLKSI